MSDQEKLKLANLSLEIDAIKKDTESKGKALEANAKSIIYASRALEGKPVSSKLADIPSFNIARLANAIAEGKNYPPHPSHDSIKQQASEYVGLIREQKNKEDLLDKLKRQLSQ